MRGKYIYLMCGGGLRGVGNAAGLTGPIANQIAKSAAGFHPKPTSNWNISWHLCFATQIESLTGRWQNARQRTGTSRGAAPTTIASQAESMSCPDESKTKWHWDFILPHKLSYIPPHHEV